jgi:hypothetical protein
MEQNYLFNSKFQSETPGGLDFSHQEFKHSDGNIFVPKISFQSFCLRLLKICDQQK